MSCPLRITYPGAFYHITSRGNEQKAVFKSRQDRTKFIEYLESTSERYSAVMHAYCEIGAYFNLGESGVSKVYLRLSQRIEKDKKLKSLNLSRVQCKSLPDLIYGNFDFIRVLC